MGTLAEITSGGHILDPWRGAGAVERDGLENR